MIFGLPLLLQAAAWAGDPVQECGKCHRAETVSQASTPMARALQRVQDSSILKNNPSLSYSEGKYSYSIRREGDKSIYSVTDGDATFTAPLALALGFGAVGQTYLFEKDGAHYEAAVSFYQALRGLDWTPAHASRPRRNLDEASGRKIDPAETRRCFGCHSTGPSTSRSQFQPESLVPGVRCGGCHDGAARHAAKIRTGEPATPAMANLSELSTEEQSNLCGRCHRTWADVGANGPRGILNVRFQPYRMTNSKCYDTVDKRIACTACHDPHAHSAKSASFYDAKCQACHSSPIPCPVAKQDCITCHMPKVEIPGLHFQFTDHRIRIALPGGKYPD